MKFQEKLVYGFKLPLLNQLIVIRMLKYCSILEHADKYYNTRFLKYHVLQKLLQALDFQRKCNVIALKDQQIRKRAAYSLIV